MFNQIKGYVYVSTFYMIACLRVICFENILEKKWNVWKTMRGNIIRMLTLWKSVKLLNLHCVHPFKILCCRCVKMPLHLGKGKNSIWRCFEFIPFLINRNSLFTSQIHCGKLFYVFLLRWEISMSEHWVFGQTIFQMIP